MVTYWKIKRTSNQQQQVEKSDLPSAEWDDSEDRELEALAKGASSLAREEVARIDAQKAEECRKQMLQQVLKS